MNIAKDHFLVAMDIVALYPSIRIMLALEAVELALKKLSGFSSSLIEIVLDFIKISLQNSIICYREEWFKEEGGDKK